MTYLATDADADEARELVKLGEPHFNRAEILLKELGCGDAFAAAQSAVEGARSAGAKMQDGMRTARGNLEHHPDGRAANERKAWETGSAAIEEHASTAQAAIAVARKKLTAACSPKEPTDAAERAELREECRMVLDSCEDAEQAILDILIGADRGLAAVAAGSLGKRWLASRGVKVDAQLQTAMDAAVVSGARAHGTAEEKRAAEALGTGGAIESLMKGVGVHIGGAKSYLGR